MGHVELKRDKNEAIAHPVQVLLVPVRGAHPSTGIQQFWCIVSLLFPSW